MSITYNQHNQTTSVTDVYQHPVAMAYTGPGQAERASADWSNQPNPSDPTKPAEFGHTTYTNAPLGVMSRTDSLGTTYYTRDPEGLPVSERTPNGTYYYLFDGLGDVAMLVDPPSSATVAITSPCPTGNQSGDRWQAPGTHALDELIFQADGAFKVITDVGTDQLKSEYGYSGAAGTGPTQSGGMFFDELESPGVGGLGGLGPGGISGSEGDTVEATGTASNFGKLDALGRLLPSKEAYDPAAHALAARIGGVPQVYFEKYPDYEMDAVSDQYVAQAKAADFKLGSRFRAQAKATFYTASETGRQTLFYFDGPRSRTC